MTTPTPSPPTAPTRPVRVAATLIVLRDGASGMEVLMLRRAEKEADQNSGASVFPGGTLDAQDRALHALCNGMDDTAASLRLGIPENGLDYYAAAVRECFEEAGLLFAGDADGRLVELDEMAPQELIALRLAVEEGADALRKLCAERGWRLAVDRLAYFSHWLTPLGMPRRFDTRFFVALAPRRQSARPDGRETVEHMWLRPADAVDPARGLKLMNVQRRILLQLANFDTAEACMEYARGARDIPLIMPRIADGPGGRRPVNPGEPAYDELSRIDPEGLGHGRYELAAGLAMQLSPRVLRVTALCGDALVNSYFVGGDRNEWALIDGGQGDVAHEATLRASAPGPVRWNLALHGAPLPHGHRIDLGGCTLRVLRQPGQGEWLACFLLEEERTLFTGSGDPSSGLDADEFEWLAPANGFLRRY
ncbi:NUDIX domain-containing protein [Variovorax sp. J22R115]|uniref:NUDIX domain-containing protein n=1 Tax=Variovorax sp. J22R115 TaxID=3053509 RepID=UPI002574C4C5|nr:NUDIX domain-containing protein [Variovorax sp. J22R115]MDM0049409.1 NUDIX domain-containing protein [Variovorax sp. J22R115]